MQDLSLPVTFRGEILQPLLAELTAGRSCSLVGVGSSGKSNVVRHLNRLDVRRHYLGGAAQHVLNLYVNCAKLTETAYTARGLYCLILEVIMKGVREAPPEVATQYSKLRALWKEAIDSESDALARSNLEDAFGAVFQAGVKQVFITLDDLDPFFANAPAPALNSLRALRDDYKDKIMYVTVTRRELGYLRDPGEVEDFLELVAPATTFAAGLYSESDAKFMIKRLAVRETPSRAFSAQEQERLLETSGRHAGLLRMIYKVTQEQVPLMSGDLLGMLRGHPAVVEECEKIWASLEKGERDDLEAVISEYQPTEEGAGALLSKGIIRARSDGSYDVFSPVFANFVVDHLKQRLPIQLLPGQQVKVNDRIIGELNSVEYHLLSCLLQRYPKPATQEQLLKEMWRAQAGQPQISGLPRRRLDACLSEIKRKIEFDNVEYILRLPGGGYRLLALAGDKPPVTKG